MKLYEAAQDNELMGELKEYFIDVLREWIIDAVFAQESVTGLGEAKGIIEKAFEDISVQFAPKVEPKEPINEAR